MGVARPAAADVEADDDGDENWAVGTHTNNMGWYQRCAEHEGYWGSSSTTMVDSLPVMRSSFGETPAVAVREEGDPSIKLHGCCNMVTAGGDDEGHVGDWQV
uniref:Uncharacterized protein n=1 Tax=Oryza nivara TaxID=4536 RepID=A0A0E0HSW6_ORYNI